MLIEFAIMNAKDVILRWKYKDIEKRYYSVPLSLCEFQNYLQFTHNTITNFFKVGKYAYAFHLDDTSGFIFYIIYDYKDYRGFDDFGLENYLRAKLKMIVEIFQADHYIINSLQIKDKDELKHWVNKTFGMTEGIQKIEQHT